MNRNEADKRIRDALKGRAYDGITVRWVWSGMFRTAIYSMTRDGYRVGGEQMRLTRGRVVRKIEQTYCYDD